MNINTFTASTRHAQARIQQRGIPPLIIDWLLKYGCSSSDHRGGERFFFDRASRKALAHDVGDVIVRKVEQYLNAYMVVVAGELVTVGYRYKPIKR